MATVAYSSTPSRHASDRSPCSNFTSEDAVDDALAAVLLPFVVEIGGHFRRRHSAQRAKILAAIGALRFAEQAFEGVEVLRRNLDRRRHRRLRRRAGAEARRAKRRARRKGRREAGARTVTRSSHGVRIATRPPIESHAGEEDDQRDLQHQPDDRHEAAHAAEEAMARQQAKEAGAEQAAGEPAKKPRPKEPPKAPPGCDIGPAMPGEGRGVTLRSKGEAWPGIGSSRGRRGPATRAAAAKAAAAAHARFGDGGR